MKTLTFYFDYISNNAYLAWTQLAALAEKHALDIRPVPVLFAGLLKANDNIGPAEIPAKREWMAKNILRKAALLNVPLNPPRYHPFNPLLALRVSSLPMDDSQRLVLIDKMFKAVWVEGRHVSEIDVIASILEESGLAGTEMLAAAQLPEASAVLKAQTAEALAKGVFGIPSMLVDGELFFGYDDFVYLEAYLEGRDPLDRAAFARWGLDSMKASARRSQLDDRDDS